MTQLLLTAPAAPLVPGPICWIGLNPSVATEKKPDPTITKERGFLEAWHADLAEPRIGYQGDRTGAQGEHRFVLTRPGMIKVNLLSVRATKPKWMLDAPLANHPDNDRWIEQAAREARTVIVAWGGPHGAKKLQGMIDARAREALDLLARIGVEPLCLGRTKDGHPRHPLMLAYATPLEPWRAPGGHA